MLAWSCCPTSLRITKATKKQQKSNQTAQQSSCSSPLDVIVRQHAVVEDVWQWRDEDARVLAGHLGVQSMLARCRLRGHCQQRHAECRQQQLLPPQRRALHANVALPRELQMSDKVITQSCIERSKSLGTTPSGLAGCCTAQAVGMLDFNNLATTTSKAAMLSGGA